MTAKTDVVQGVAQLLHDAGVGVYRALGGYTDDDTAIVFKTAPPAPDRCITLTCYDLPAGNMLGLQVRCRGRANAYLDADTIADQVQDALHGQRGLVFGDVRIPLVAWQTGGGLGLDDSGRDETTSTYYLTVDRPGASLVDVTT